MGKIDKYPDFISSAYEKVLIEQWSESGLYKWAQANQYAIDGVNLLSRSYIGEVTLYYRGGRQPAGYEDEDFMHRQEVGIIEAEVTGISLFAGNDTGIESQTPNIIPNTTFALALYRARVSDIEGRQPQAGRLRGVATWLQGDQASVYNSKTLPSRTVSVWDIKNYDRGTGSMTMDIDPVGTGIMPIGVPPVGTQSSKPYLDVRFDTRLLLGMPTGFRFDVGSAPVGTGWLNNHEGLNDKYHTFEMLIRTGVTSLATEQVLFGRVLSGSGWATRMYISNGTLFLIERNATHTVMSNVQGNTMLHIVVMVNDDPSTAASNPDRGAIRVFVNGALVYSVAAGNTGSTEVGELALGANPNSQSQRNYFRGTMHHFRHFNMFLSDSYAEEFWNAGRPWEYIMPYSYTAKGTGVLSSADNCYGCVCELLPQNCEMDYPPSDYNYWFSSSPDKSGYGSCCMPMRDILPERVWIDPSTGADVAEQGRLRAPYEILFDKVMFYRWRGKELPWQYTPTELLPRLDPENDVIDPVTIDLYNESGNIERTVTMERSAEVDGIARFDLSYILCRGFSNRQARVYDRTYNDFNLTGRYRINSDNSLVKYFVRSIAQFGDMLDLITPRMLMSRKPVHYMGYPLDIAIFQPALSTAHGNIGLQYANGSGSGSATYPVFQPVTVVRAGLINGWWGTGISINQSGQWLDPIAIQQACVPHDPFYVRWINEMGGYDYEMFDRARNYEDEVANIQSIQKQASNQYNTQETIYAEGYTYITVGRDGIDIEDYDALKKLARSPLIQWWNAEQQQWHTIILQEDTSNERNTRSGVYSVEFTFQMPRLRLQF